MTFYVNVYLYSKVVMSFISFINRLKRSVVITGWAVALICYVNNRAKHKKRADFDPLRAKPIRMILIKRSMVDYVRDPTPHDSIGGVSATWVVWADRVVVINRK